MGKELTEGQKAQIANSTLITRRLITIELETPFRILENDSTDSIDVTRLDTNNQPIKDENGEVIIEKYYTKLVKTSEVQGSLDGNSEKIDVIISDIGQDFAGLVADNCDVLTNTPCKIEQVILDGDPTTIVGNPILLFEGLINNLQMSQYACSFSVERALYSYSMVSPNMTYDVNCQFAFKDSRCGYKETETKCNKTISRCKELNNVINFGGYPSVVIPVTYS